jgi:RimJ/RimL family protein N-acetyltransferase
VDDSIARFAEHGWGLWLVFERAAAGAADPAGLAGLLASPSGGPPNLIYAIRPELEGRGLATEAAAAVLAHAQGALGLERVAADVDEPNQASVRVLEKLGLTLRRRALVAERPLLFFETARTPPRQEETP